MKKFCSAVVNEWKQNWLLLLILFICNIYYLAWKTGIIYYYHGESFLLILLILCCSIPVVMAPNLIVERITPPVAVKHSRSKIMSSIILHWKSISILLLSVCFYILWPVFVINTNWGRNGNFSLISIFILLMLFCIILVLWILPQIMCRLYKFDWRKFIGRLTPLWRISILLLPLVGYYILSMEMQKCPCLTREWYNLFDLFLPVFFFSTIILLCIAFFGFGRESTVACNPGMAYWVKFFAGGIQFMALTMYAFGICHMSEGEFFYYSFSLLPLIIAAGVYVLVFFVSITMPKVSRFVVFITAIPLASILFFVLAPGVIGAIALFGTDYFFQNIFPIMLNMPFESIFEWLTFAYPADFLFDILIVLYPCLIILPLVGYWLWTRKVATGKKYFRKLFLIAGLLFIGSMALWIIAENTSQKKLLQAEQAAQAFGVIYEPSQILLASPPVPAERNAARLYQQAFKILKRKHDGGGRFFFTGNVDFQNIQAFSASSETRIKLIDFVMSPEGKQVNVLIEQANTYPECRFIPQSKDSKINLFVDEMKFLADFIIARAYVYKFTERDDEILPELEKCMRMSERIDSKLISKSSRSAEYMAEGAMIDAIRIGPENPAAIICYRRMFDYLTGHPINNIPNYFMEFLYENLNRGIIRSSNSLICYPLAFRVFANYININIDVRREILKIRQFTVMPPEFILSLNPYSINLYSNILRGGVRSLFSARSSQTMLKIGLALKIYKCEHGKYPAALRELAPTILPAIPVDPLDGKAFGYTVKNGNFILTRNAKFNYSLSSEFSL